MQLRYSSPFSRFNDLVCIIVNAIRRRNYGKAIKFLKYNHDCIKNIIVYDEPLLS
jgi:hypothetical protein